MREPAPYPIAIEGHEEIKQLVEPRFHPHTPLGRYEAIEPHMDTWTAPTAPTPPPAKCEPTAAP